MIEKLELRHIAPSCLRMPLKAEWFEMTKAKIKREDYRGITPYWCNRLLLFDGVKKSKEEWFNMFFDANGEPMIDRIIKCFWVKFKHFDINKMTLGYPKSTDSERILRLEHKGIEIRTGKPEWGAEPNKLYFVIKHGTVIS